MNPKSPLWLYLDSIGLTQPDAGDDYGYGEGTADGRGSPEEPCQANEYQEVFGDGWGCGFGGGDEWWAFGGWTDIGFAEECVKRGVSED